MKIEVKSTATTKKDGTSQKSGKAYSITEQEAWAHVNGEYRRLRIALKDGAQPYPVGEYALAESSFIVNQFGGLEFGRIELVAAIRKAA
jgi:hypothetical protein